MRTPAGADHPERGRRADLQHLRVVRGFAADQERRARCRARGALHVRAEGQPWPPPLGDQGRGMRGRLPTARGRVPLRVRRVHASALRRPLCEQGGCGRVRHLRGAGGCVRACADRCGCDVRLSTPEARRGSWGTAAQLDTKRRVRCLHEGASLAWSAEAQPAGLGRVADFAVAAMDDSAVAADDDSSAAVADDDGANTAAPRQRVSDRTGPVQQLDPSTGEILQTFPSMRAALVAMGMNRKMSTQRAKRRLGALPR